jgi:hypothetical protein
MNGFLLSILPSESPTPSNKSPVPFDNELVECLNITSGITLLTWGPQLGDIHISYKKNCSLLIMSGYICEAPQLVDISDQQAACDQVRSLLDDAPGTLAISKLAAEIHGSFSFVYISLQEDIIWTCTDRLSSRQIWSHSQNNSLQISSHAVALARHSNIRSYDPGPLASYFLYATQVEPTRSIFSGIVCQKEGTVSKSTLHRPQSTTTTTTWYRFRHKPENNRSLSSWVQLTADHFVASAERILKTTSSPLLFLSGGVDSRLAGASLVAAGGRPLCCTLGDSANLEVQIAKKVARALHCPQEIVFRDDEWYLRGIPRAMFDANGSFTWSHSHFSVAYSRIQQKMSVDAAILGDFCEAFSKLCSSVRPDQKAVWSTKEFVNYFDQRPLPNYRPGNRSGTLKLLQKDFSQAAQKDLAAAIASRYESVVDVADDPLIVGDYFFRWQNAACIPTFQMFNDVRSAGMERNLMFDKELQQLLEIMPSEIRSSKNLGSKIVHKLCPQAAWVPNANSLLPLHLPLTAHAFAKIMRPKLGKIRRKLFSNNYKTTDSWQHLPLLYSKQPTWKQRIEENLLDNSLLPRDVFDHTAIASCWHHFCDGDISRHGDIERLFGLGELQRLLS